MTKSNFETKEQYFAFRNAWKLAVNSDKSKSHLIAVDEWISSTDSFSTGTGTHRVKGWITASHHILFNLLRGKPIDNGFTPVTNINKLKNDMKINHGLYHAYVYLIDIQEDAQYIVNNKIENWDNYKGLINFLEPLDDTITVEMLAAIKIPKVEPLHSGFSRSKQVAQAIIKGDFKPNNFKQVYEYLKQLMT